MPGGVADVVAVERVEGLLRAIISPYLTSPVESRGVHPLRQPLTHGVHVDGLVPPQHGGGDGQVDRGLRLAHRVGQSAERRVQRGQEVLVALEQRGGRATERLAEQRLDLARVDPDVTKVADVGEVVDLGQRECRSVDPSCRRAADDVHAGGAAGQIEQPSVDAVCAP